jgi:hypothetical protein
MGSACFTYLVLYANFSQSFAATASATAVAFNMIVVGWLVHAGAPPAAGACEGVGKEAGRLGRGVGRGLGLAGRGEGLGEGERLGLGEGRGEGEGLGGEYLGPA